MNNELEGKELDIAVAKALSINGVLADGRAMAYHCPFDTGPSECEDGDIFEPSKIWAHGGPIIEKYKITITINNLKRLDWFASVDAWMCHDLVVGEYCAVGDTPLIAAMRAFVKSKNGCNQNELQDTFLQVGDVATHFDKSITAVAV